MKRFALFLALLLVVNVISVSSAANVVPESGAGRNATSKTVADLAPSGCGTLSAGTTIRNVLGDVSNNLVLGGPQMADPLSGNHGNDCLVGGAAADVLSGGPGIDVCIGGPGNDVYEPSCETQIDDQPVAGCPGTVTAWPSADAEVSTHDSVASKNYGSLETLRVGEPASDLRAFLRFSLPTKGTCTVTAATLMLYGSGAAATRTLELYRVVPSWDESGITGANQPAFSGTAVSITSPIGTPSAWRSWTATAMVTEMYAGTVNSFMIKDATETGSSTGLQTFNSREGETGNIPRLVITLSP